MDIRPKDLIIDCSIDYLSISLQSPLPVVINFLKNNYQYIKSWSYLYWKTSIYRIPNGFGEIYYSFNKDNSNLQIINIYQPSQAIQYVLFVDLVGERINFMLSRFELAFDIRPFNILSNILLSDIQKFLEQHLYQKGLWDSTKEFRIGDKDNHTFYSCSTRGSRNKGIKIYQRVDKKTKTHNVIRCELELKRSIIQKLGLTFPMVKFDLNLEKHFLFLQFNKKKLSKKLRKNNLKNTLRHNPRSFKEIQRGVKKIDKTNWKQYFDECDEWNNLFQEYFDYTYGTWRQKLFNGFSFEKEEKFNDFKVLSK